MPRTGTVLLWGWLWLCSVHAARAALPETPRFTRFDVRAGAPAQVGELALDRQGYLWMATADGLARFDGVRFRYWRKQVGLDSALPDNEVVTLHVDVHDRVWAATPAGLSVLGQDRRGFRHIRFDGAGAACRRGVLALADAPGGGVWAGTDTGHLCHSHDGRRFRHLATLPLAPDGVERAIWTLHAARDGALWLGTSAGLFRYAHGRLRAIAPARLGRANVTHVRAEADGSYWIGSDLGLHRLLRDGRIAGAPWHLPPDATHPVVLRDRDSHWIGTMAGLFRAARGRLWPVEYDPATGIGGPGTGIHALQTDHEGGLWAVTHAQGLVYLPAGWHRFTTITTAGGVRLETLDLRDAAGDRDGGWWVATATDLYRLERGRTALRHVAGRDALGTGWIRALRVRGDGRVWLAHSRGLSLFDPRSGRAAPWPDRARAQDFGSVMRVLPLTDGTLWLAQEGGRLRHYAADGTILHELMLPGPTTMTWHGAAEPVADRAGTLWLADPQALHRWDGTGFRRVPLPPGEPATAMTVDPAGRIWVARLGALEAYAWDGLRLRLCDRIGAADGLPVVKAAHLFAAGGRIWLATVRGLFAYAPHERRLRAFGARDGLPALDLSRGVPKIGQDGTAATISSGALVLFDPALPWAASPPPRLALDTLAVRRDEDERLLAPGDRLVLQPQDRELHVVARLLSFADPQAHRYRFRLEGYDPDWVEASADGERTFSALPPGRHRLSVIGAGFDGRWSAPRRIEFTVLPPWWRTGWARALFAAGALFLLAALAAAYRARLRRRHALQLIEHERRLAEQASEAKSRFLATLGHEVRTPMTGVLGMSELLLGTPLTPPQRAQAEAIRRAGEHLLRLVDDALDLARIEAGRLELRDTPFDLAALVAEVVALKAPLAQARGLRFEHALAADVPCWLRGDAVRVRQILLNLLGNAVKFTERGHVRLAVGRALQGVRFEVADTGPGLDEAQRARLFRRFAQADGAHTHARYGGSGLGLAICQELAGAMGGCIAVDSAPGQGTRFTVELPLAEAAPVAASPAQAPRVAVAPGVTLLLVEDDPIVADTLAGLLRAQGHTVAHAPHALAALAAVATQRFDLVLLDLDLPGMDGLALARELRAQGCTAPLLAITARADPDAEPQARAAGCAGFLRKPMTNAILAQAVEACKRGQSAFSTEKAL
ncbi:hybrid sensor histidine kinase/response regulator [Vulcaniibacterium gelatinicum]|uniref:hybrid sensor histidine kinase/response regulator n=1 Tax=Vulcaniibacterium gelatinicum TaxID=2598725 RepID=UPI0011C8F501|nr:hybrid sensor histidine kinase/response regulator [Vulcaniibacterium gelatinicum]